MWADSLFSQRAPNMRHAWVESDIWKARSSDRSISFKQVFTQVYSNYYDHPTLSETLPPDVISDEQV